MIRIHTHTFRANEDGSNVKTNSFISPLAFANWMADAVKFYISAVKFGEFEQVQIVLDDGTMTHEIHIETIRGEVKASEFDVTDYHLLDEMLDAK